MYGSRHDAEAAVRQSLVSNSSRHARRIEPPPIPRGCLSCTVLNAVLMLIAGLLLLVLAPILLRGYIATLLPISSPTAIIFDMWQDTQSASILKRSFYVFNLTNAHDVFHHHAVPDYKRIGPFVYRERTYNPIETIFWLPNTSIHYKYKTELHFDAELSVDDEGNQLDPTTTHIVNINIPLFAAAYRLSKFPDIEINITTGITVGKRTACGIFEALVGEQVVGPAGIFTNRTVGELLFGYQDEIWTAFSAMGSLMDYSAPTQFRVFWNVSQPAPSPYTYRSGQKCPMWDDQSICNSSAKDASHAYSGADWHTSNNPYTGGGKDAIGAITQWAGQTELAWWPETEEGTCRIIKGGNGMFYPIGIDESAKPYVFIDALFRDVQMEFERHSTVKGIKTLRFNIAKSEIAEFGPNSECFDQNFLGLLNISRPTFGPLFASLPFFQRTPPVQIPRGGTEPVTLLNFTIDGVHIADFQERHKGQFETYVDVLPVTGTLLEGSANLQTATRLGSITIDDCPRVFPQLLPRNITDMSGKVIVNSSFPTSMIPIFYIDRHAVVTDALARRIRNTVLLPFIAVNVLGAIFCAICPIVLIVGALWIRRDRLRRMKALHHAMHRTDGSAGGGGVRQSFVAANGAVGNGAALNSDRNDNAAAAAAAAAADGGGGGAGGAVSHRHHYHQHYSRHHHHDSRCASAPLSVNGDLPVGGRQDMMNDGRSSAVTPDGSETSATDVYIAAAANLDAGEA